MRWSLPLLVLVASGCASYELDGVAAFSSVQSEAPEDVSPFFDDEAGVRVAVNASRSIATPGLLRGSGGNGLRGNISLSGSRYDGNGDSELTIISPQIGPSFRLSAANLFAEAGATGGAAIATVDTRVGDDDEFTWAARPYLRAGVIGDWFFAGVEGGYEITGLDFGVGPAGEDYENWYVGVLVGFRLTN
ncbi:MAG: hypothetical protein AAGI46_01470 [Planctomycetota bacterium]